MFRRRRAVGADKVPHAEGPDDQPGQHGDEDAEQRGRDAEQGGRDAEQAGGDAEQGGRRGPWDLTDPYPERDRVDLGSLQVPTSPGCGLQLNVSGDQAVAVLVVRGESMLQLQAFAASKRTRLWDDIRHELIKELTDAGGQAEERTGPFGVEVRARVPDEAGGRNRRALQPARFLGADGPRWFLHGVIRGPAAAHPKYAKVFEDVFADTVVVRGDHPMPPRDVLALRLPAEAQKALEEQMAQAAGGLEPLDPFVRGPEITETR